LEVYLARILFINVDLFKETYTSLVSLSTTELDLFGLFYDVLPEKSYSTGFAFPSGTLSTFLLTY
jgi:hypothetical protein